MQAQCRYNIQLIFNLIHHRMVAHIKKKNTCIIICGRSLSYTHPPTALRNPNVSPNRRTDGQTDRRTDMTSNAAYQEGTIIRPRKCVL